MDVTFTTKDKQKHTVSYLTGETLKENADLFGEEPVNSLFLQKLVIWVADFCRPKAEAGMPLPEIQAALDARKPGVTGPRVSKADPVSSFLAKFAKMTPEAQLTALRQIKETQRAAA